MRAREWVAGQLGVWLVGYLLGHLLVSKVLMLQSGALQTATAMKVRTELATAALVGGKFRRGVRGAKHTRSKKQGGKSKGGRANPLSNALRGNSYRVMCLSSE